METFLGTDVVHFWFCPIICTVYVFFHFLIILILNNYKYHITGNIGI